MDSRDVDPVLVEIFEAEVSEAVDVIQADVLRLEQGDPDADGLLEEVLRLAHDVKGSARVLGFSDAGELSHALEDRLVRWRGAERAVPEEADLVLRAADTLRALAKAPEDAALLEATATLIPALRTVGDPARTAPSAERESQPPRPERPSRSSVDQAATVKVSGDALGLVRTGVSALLADSFIAESHAGRLFEALGEIVREELPEGASSSFARARTQMRDAVQGMQSVVRLLNAHAKTLAEHARTLGVAPVTGLIVHLERTVRDAARTVGREVDFDVDGRDMLLDAQFLEPLKAPLTHLLRNAVDHGLESAACRLGAGKPTIGRIRVRLSSDGEHFEIVVTDDGRGLDLERLRDRLGEAAEGMSDQEIMNTIFRPGVTTRETATLISGRGVGLDSVATMVRDLGGRVFVTSHAGQGSTFRLILPMCLSVVEGIVAEAGGVRFVVPTSGLDDVGVAGGDELPLAEVFGMQAGRPKHSLRLHGHEGVVAVGVEFAAYATLDVVTLPLPSHLGHVPHVIGATILNRGDPALILDARGLADHLLGAGAPEVRRVPAGDLGPPTVLVADDSTTMRTQLATALEEAGFRVETAEDAAQAVAALGARAFDAVVSDIQMPGGSGFDVLDAAPDDIPVVLCTAYPDEQGRERARQGGALHYFAKDTGIGARVVLALLAALPNTPTIEGAIP